MNIIGHFTLRSLKHNRKRTLVTIIGIIISAAMITAVSTFTSSFMALMQNETIADGGNWHATIANVPKQNVKLAEASAFAGEVMLSRDIGYAMLKGSKNTSKPYLFILQQDENSSKNFHITLTDGRLPQNDGEIALSQSVETNGGVKYRIGDSLTLDIGKRKLPDGTMLSQSSSFQYPQQEDQQTGSAGDPGEKLVPEITRTYTVVGIIKQPDFESSWSPGYTAVTYLDEEALEPGEMVNISLLAKKLGRHFFDDTAALAKEIGANKSDISFNSELLRYYGLTEADNTQKTIYGFALIITIIIMVASIALIYNAFAISVSERTQQLGMLASVGATKRQKSRNVYFEGFLMGLIGVPLGILAGILGIGVTFSIIRPLMESFTNLASSGLHLVVSPLSIAAAIAFSALTILISAWIPARRASKIMPIDAIRQSKEVRLSAKTVRTWRLTRWLFGFEGEIALKNLKRSRKKYRATVLSLIISLVLFLTVSYYAETINSSYGAIETGYNFDFMVSYTNTPGAEARNINEKIASLEGVTDTAAVETANVFFTAENAQLSDLVRRAHFPDGEAHSLAVTLYCFDNESFSRYADSLGADPQEYLDPGNPRMILINYGQGYSDGKRAAGELLSIQPGDMLVFSRNTTAESAGESSAELKAGLLTDRRPMGVLVSSLDNVSAVVSRQVFDALPDSLKNIDSSGRPSYQRLFLTTEKPDILETQIQDLTQSISGRTYIFNVAQQARSEHNIMLVLGIFIYGFITLISLICVANIFNTVSTNVALRRREFAMLRSVGMTPKSFNRMIRYESAFYGVKALLYGLPISIAIGVLLYKVQGGTFDVGFSFPWASYAAAIVLIFIIVTSTMLYSSAKLKKENIIDGLKAENL